jgi:hypothetical protein
MFQYEVGEENRCSRIGGLEETHLGTLLPPPIFTHAQHKKKSRRKVSMSLKEELERATAARERVREREKKNATKKKTTHTYIYIYIHTHTQSYQARLLFGTTTRATSMNSFSEKELQVVCEKSFPQLPTTSLELVIVSQVELSGQLGGLSI